MLGEVTIFRPVSLLKESVQI